MLTQSLERVTRDEASLVMVEGEPGAGKTSLLEEFSKVAGQRQAAVAWGRCLSHEGIPALWPWTQVLAELRRDQSADIQARSGRRPSWGGSSNRATTACWAAQCCRTAGRSSGCSSRRSR